jgi:hypothetical protein
MGVVQGWGLFWGLLYIALVVFWMILVFHIVIDVFRSHDLNGAMKALWLLFILVLPLIGCLLYVLIRGSGMHQRDVQNALGRQKAFEDYIRSIASSKE